MTQLLRVQNFNVSSDGIGAGESQSLERPFGHAVDPAKLFGWAGATASWPMRTEPGGSRGLDDCFTRDHTRNIGAEIMGRNKFGPQRGPWNDHEWRGWWGDEPPFRTPVFVLTHHERPSFTLSDTTFHFVDADPATVLERARQAARGKDVRLGGGVSTVRGVLDADLVDTPACGGLAGEARDGAAALGLPRRAARPVPPGGGAQPERRDAPSVLAQVSGPRGRSRPDAGRVRPSARVGRPSRSRRRGAGCWARHRGPRP